MSQTQLIPDGAAKPLQPLLKWAGGKRWLVPHLKHIWKEYQHLRLVEPLCGGLAVTFGLMPKQAHLNDVNNHLINFYDWVRKEFSITIQMEHNKELFYSHRNQFNQLIKDDKANTLEAAQLFFYLNRSCYNGLCRFNKSGLFNVPFGQYKKVNYERDFKLYKKTIKKWKFTSGDFAKVKLTKTDFVYADPPYDVEFTSYSKEGFNWDEQVRLAEWLTKHSGPVVLSNQATKNIIELYEGLDYKLEYLDAPRMISCTGDRARAKEVLATLNL